MWDEHCWDHLTVCFLLLQVSQYTFAMCSYREKKAEPQELLQLDGYTVDYTDPQPGTCPFLGCDPTTCSPLSSQQQAYVSQILGPC